MRILRFLSVFQFACAGLAIGVLITLSSQDALALTLHATDDAYIQTDDSDENKGSSEKIKLKDDGGDDDRIGFVKFDLSPLPDGVEEADIIKATARLWIRKVSDDGTITVKSADEDWDEEDLTADNAPSTDGPVSPSTTSISIECSFSVSLAAASAFKP